MNKANEQVMSHPVAVIRPGLIDRLKAQGGIRSDDAFARLIGTSRATLQKLKAGAEPSLRVTVGIAQAFGLGLGEVVEMREPEATESMGEENVDATDVAA